MPTIDQARDWYDESDPVHGLSHVLRVLALVERMGEELGADLEVLRAAALLHDAAGAHPGEGADRQAHEQMSAIFAGDVLKKDGWEQTQIDAVQHCIRAHRFRGNELPTTLEAKILFDADKLDVMGAFGAARTLGYALQAGQPFFAEPSEHFLRTGETEDGEAHSAYHEYLFKLCKVKDRLHTGPAKRLALERHAVLTAFFNQMAVEARGMICL
ncbi:MAG: HD domain-containing protein [Anaerolineales bacterium]|jgi:uncharacterized protein|nr:HD domain-containing protein [Anaerolineales bacterium]